MKPANTVDRAFSCRRTVFTVASFLMVAIVCILASMNEIQLRSLVDISRSSFVFLRGESSKPPALRVLVGIITKADFYRRRDLLRLVYGLQSPVKNAQVDVRFVLCSLQKEDQKVLVALEIMRYNDIIILNCTENMNNGKTYTYFSSLPEILDVKEGEDRPYDYVMKADDDAYLRLDQLVKSLIELPREDLYYGFVIPCREMNPEGRYMSGMGYTLSWDLVKWIATSEVARNRITGSEDRLVGEWLQKGSRGKNRYNAKPAMYNYPLDSDACSHQFVPNTIAVHRLKDQTKWVRTLQYFNVTRGLKPSKLYHIG
ncbi:hypothetical protein ACLOJK_030653 [Asimina triloba]